MLRKAWFFSNADYLCAMRKLFEPCIPTRGAKVPDRPDWIHEIKHDGYRLIVQREGKRVRLFTRNGHDWSGRYPLMSEAALRNREQLVRDRRRGGAARRRRHLRLQRTALAASTMTRCSSTPSTA